MIGNWLSGVSMIKRLVVILILLFIIPGCHPAPAREGFAIYLTRDNVPPALMEALSHVETAEQPVISAEDIVNYYAQTHEIELTPAAFERISRLEVPVQGTSFLVCVDNAPLYWGAFWTPVSSVSFGGVTIWKPFAADEPRIITLELGYPSASFYRGRDPRDDQSVMAALQRDGKLVLHQSITSIEQLPRSMKGYELYSWLADGKWHFTLITGTNRNKTWQEIVSGEDSISQSGWIKAHVVGKESIKDALSRVPKGESVFWLDGRGLAQGVEPAIDMRLPPDEITNAIKYYASVLGLDMMVAGR
jgi:hypothetical protein